MTFVYAMRYSTHFPPESRRFSEPCDVCRRVLDPRMQRREARGQTNEDVYRFLFALIAECGARHGDHAAAIEAIRTRRDWRQAASQGPSPSTRYEGVRS
jgi:hypothetical protein